eukprot:14786485-Ditylum_brightwellii.AAC.1
MPKEVGDFCSGLYMNFNEDPGIGKCFLANVLVKAHDVLFGSEIKGILAATYENTVKTETRKQVKLPKTVFTGPPVGFARFLRSTPNGHPSPEQPGGISGANDKLTNCYITSFTEDIISFDTVKNTAHLHTIDS